MTPSVCICCGEPIIERGNVMSRNPNICGSCSSLVDGMDESSISLITVPAPEETRSPARGVTMEKPAPLFSSRKRTRSARR
jgi:hypothetical protein